MLSKKDRRQGVVYTRQDVVQFILNEVNYCPNNDLSKVRILEPASGIGAFAYEIINRLYLSSINYGFDFLSTLNNNVVFVEKDVNSFHSLRINIVDILSDLGYNNINLKCLFNANFLVEENLGYFDCIVGNPPYIRYDSLDIAYRLKLKKLFETFRYRPDLYVTFYEKSLKLLNKNGILSFICSNRWLYNQYGSVLRGFIASKFHISKLVNIEKTSPFVEKVIGYPCISTIINTRGSKTLYYETNSKEVNFSDIIYNEIDSPNDASWQNLFLNYNIYHKSLKPILDQDFEIGIGVATGADKVFIKQGVDLYNIEKDRMIPLIKSNALKGNNISWDNTYVLNPYENGHLCDLNKFPNFKKYLLEHQCVLKKRYIAKKNPDYWYKTIDKIKNDLIRKPKILLPDLSGSEYLFIDEGKFYPHHNVYYITNHDIDRLKILASLLMSDFVKNQLSQVGLRMNDGLPRFQSQALKKLRIPDIDSFESNIKSKLINAYNRKDMIVINYEINRYILNNGI